MHADGRGHRSESIGQRLRRLRTDRGLSQRDLAEPGVSYAYISRIEAGTRQPSVKALRKLARKLGVSADYLETGSTIGAEQRREIDLADAELALRFDQDVEEAVRRLRAVLEESLGAGDVETAARARIALGGVALDAGRPAEAIALLEEVVETESVSASTRPDVFEKLGHAYAANGEAQRAIELFERCLDELDEDEGPVDVAARVQYATHLSYALSDVDRLDEAQTVLRGILRDGDSLTDPYVRTKLYWSLARLSSMRGRHAASLAYARRAVALLEATEDTIQLGRAHLLCGAILVRQGRPEEAEERLALAEKLMGPRPAAGDLAYLRTEQARAAVLLRRGAEAAERARAALQLLGDTEPGERGSAWLALGEALSLEGELPAAIDAFGRATEALERAGKLQEAAEAFRTWGRVLRAEGRETDALDALERAAELGVRAGRAETRTEA